MTGRPVRQFAFDFELFSGRPAAGRSELNGLYPTALWNPKIIVSVYSCGNKQAAITWVIPKALVIRRFFIPVFNLLAYSIPIPSDTSIVAQFCYIIYICIRRAHEPTNYTR